MCTTPGWKTPTRTIACAPPRGLFILWRRRLRSYHPQGLFGLAEGALKRHTRNSQETAVQLPKVDRAVYPPVYLIDHSFWSSLVDRARCNIALTTAVIIFEARRGTLWYDLWAWARLLTRSPLVEVHDLSPRLLSKKAKQPTDCLGDVGPV